MSHNNNIDIAKLKQEAMGFLKKDAHLSNSISLLNQNFIEVDINLDTNIKINLQSSENEAFELIPYLTFALEKKGFYKKYRLRDCSYQFKSSQITIESFFFEDESNPKDASLTQKATKMVLSPTLPVDVPKAQSQGYSYTKADKINWRNKIEGEINEVLNSFFKQLNKSISMTQNYLTRKYKLATNVKEQRLSQKFQNFKNNFQETRAKNFAYYRVKEGIQNKQWDYTKELSKITSTFLGLVIENHLTYTAIFKYMGETKKIEEKIRDLRNFKKELYKYLEDIVAKTYTQVLEENYHTQAKYMETLNLEMKDDFINVDKKQLLAQVIQNTKPIFNKFSFNTSDFSFSN